MHELVIIETGHIDSRFKHEVLHKYSIYTHQNTYIIKKRHRTGIFKVEWGEALNPAPIYAQCNTPVPLALLLLPSV